MKYSVKLRMDGASGTQFLIDSWDNMDLIVAFNKGHEVAESLDKGHYVEIVGEDNEVVATFN